MIDLHTDRWQLPDGVDELLPDAAWAVERLRRRFSDLCHACGYELVMPPIIEYIESLLTGTGEQMNLQTFKLVDQHNGRTLGVRADMTPQVARIDAHAMRSEHPNRLFYTGTVLRARADGFGGSRSVQQFGAEIFGHDGVESDIETMRLMLDSVGLAQPDRSQLILDLGHVGVYASLVKQAGLEASLEAAVFEAMQRGSLPEVRQLLAPLPEDNIARKALPALLGLRGDLTTLNKAQETLEGSATGVFESLATLNDVVAGVRRSHPQVHVQIDLAELRGYRYHTGVVFAVHDPSGRELAHGGRYDSIGAAFGRSRPATGFSGNLVTLATGMLEASAHGSVQSPGESSATQHTRVDGVFVAAELVIQALDEIARLRAAGVRVVLGLPGSAMNAVLCRCDRELIRQADRWQVRPNPLHTDERQHNG